MTSPAEAPRPTGRWRRILFPPPNHENSDNPIGSSFALTVIAVFVQGLSRFGYSLLVGNVLGSEILGQVNLAISLSLFLVLLWPQASGNAAAKFIAMARGQQRPDEQLAVAAYTSRVTAAATAGLSVVAVVVATRFLHLPWSYAVSAGLLVVGLSAYNYVRGVRTGNNQFVTTALWDCISSGITLTLLLVVLLGGLTPVLLLPLSLGYLVYAVPGWPRAAGARLPKQLRREITSFTAWAAVNILTASGLLQLSMMLGKLYDTPAAVGQYSAAVSIATPASMLSSSMLVALSPAVARMFTAGDLTGMKRQLDSILRLMVVVFLPVFGIGILWAGQIIHLLYNARAGEFTQAAPLLVVLFFAVSATSFNASNSRLQGGESWGVRAMAACNALGLVLGIATILWWGPELGVMAAAIGYLVGCLVSSLGPLIVVWIHDRMAWTGLMARVLTGYALILVGLWFVHGHPGLGSTILATALFLVTWCAVSWRDIAARADSLRRRTSGR
ncbi:lipopolysaccharide biosynthesis protein [Kocuria rhizophila]|uniref:lipopolysaccharide biosynthesis protein n=1 Tax=Kocuria rhizophila TaxID=72000 RepID=UPI001D4D7E15|nr:lipopolysaccharide biosynthesis protein [Kocuria rhizophila]MCC5672499.1 lipopolysaccharide biosynthesis protein [Kocuria rhizophila]